jgi:pimeloyl-ACP methyl ester carboxylesterase
MVTSMRVFKQWRRLMAVAALTVAVAVTTAGVPAEAQENAPAAVAKTHPQGAAATASVTASRQSLSVAAAIPVLRWHSCDDGFQCASARVPLNYQHPRGTTISIAVIRHLATDRAHRVGTLFFNSGGPAEQIAPLIASFSGIPAEIRARFDIIAFDPRGFGFSTAVRCFPSAAAENALLGDLPPFPVGAQQDAAWEKTWARFDALCVQRNGALLDHDTTADEARDMNLLRQAVGARWLNYLALSYGTALGATYANLFPATVGHMVLDGNLNPKAWPSGGTLPGALRLGEDLSLQATMRSFLAQCGAVRSTACAFTAGTPAATQAKFARLLRRLRQHSVTIGTPPQTFTYADTLASVPLETLSQWQAGAALLQQLWTASTGGRGTAASAQAVPAAATPDTAYAGPEQAYAQLCADAADPRGARAYEAAARLAEARSGGFGLYMAWREEPCAAWPANAPKDRYTGPWNRHTANPILVIGITGDPVTSYQDSVAMSKDLARARLLTVAGSGHTEFLNPSTCAINDEIRYLTSGALPRRGTVCAQNGTPFPAPTK